MGENRLLYSDDSPTALAEEEFEFPHTRGQSIASVIALTAASIHTDVCGNQTVVPMSMREIVAFVQMNALRIITHEEAIADRVSTETEHALFDAAMLDVAYALRDEEQHERSVPHHIHSMRLHDSRKRYIRPAHTYEKPSRRANQKQKTTIASPENHDLCEADVDLLKQQPNYRRAMKRIFIYIEKMANGATTIPAPVNMADELDALRLRGPVEATFVVDTEASDIPIQFSFMARNTIGVEGHIRRPYNLPNNCAQEAWGLLPLQEQLAILHVAAADAVQSLEHDQHYFDRREQIADLYAEDVEVIQRQIRQRPSVESGSTQMLL